MTDHSELVPYSTARLKKEWQDERRKKLSDKEYYRRTAVRNRESAGIPDKSFTAEQVFALEKRKRKLKKRRDAIEERLEREAIDDWF